MALVSLNGSLAIPRLPTSVVGPPSYATGLVTDAAGEKIAFVFNAPKTGSIDRIGFRTSTVTTGATVDVRIETFNSSTGEPSGTLWGTNTNASQVIANSDDNVWFEVTLTASASVTEGNIVAIVIVPSGTPSIIWAAYADDLSIGFPEAMLYTTSWAYYAGGSPVCSVRYDDGTYPAIQGFYPLSAFNTHTFNSTSTPDVYANKFTPVMSCTVNGAWVWSDFDGDSNFKIYSSDGVTVLVTASMPLNIPKAAASSLNFVSFSELELTAGNTYYIAVEPSSVTSLTLYSMDSPSSSVMNQLSLSTGMRASTAKDPTGVGSWTDNNARQMFLGLLINKLSDGASSSGGTRSVAHYG